MASTDRAGCRIGEKAGDIGATIGKSAPTIRRWRRRFAAKEVDGLLRDANRPLGLKPLSAKKVQHVVDMTSSRGHRMRPIGASAAWRRPASRALACSASGARTA